LIILDNKIVANIKEILTARVLTVKYKDSKLEFKRTLHTINSRASNSSIKPLYHKEKLHLRFPDFHTARHSTINTCKGKESAFTTVYLRIIMKSIRKVSDQSQ